MAVELGRLPAPPYIRGFQFVRVSSMSELCTWWEIACEVNGRPCGIASNGARCYARMALEPESEMRCYLGWLGGEPVATACLVFGAGVAGLYGVGTLLQARRCGIGTAMTLAALEKARQLGYLYGVLRASAQGALLYLRLGFREYGRFGTYVWERYTACEE